MPQFISQEYFYINYYATQYTLLCFYILVCSKSLADETFILKPWLVNYYQVNSLTPPRLPKDAYTETSRSRYNTDTDPTSRSQTAQNGAEFTRNAFGGFLCLLHEKGN